MSLVLAFKKRQKSLADAQNTYKTNVVYVNTFMNSVLTSSLPTLNTNPPDWSDFVTAYTSAKSNALNWVNNVLAELLDVPDNIQNYNTVISSALEDAKDQATTLLLNPNNPSAKQALAADLKTLTSQLNLIVTFISGAVNSIQTFKNNLPTLATQLQTIATKSAKDAKADQAQIDQLNQDIQQLQSDIKSLTAAIVALGIVDGVALTIGVVATIALWPEGALVWFVMGPAVAIASTYIALDALQIKADKAKIATDQQQITGLTADVATLNVLAKNFGGMADEVSQVQTNLQAILVEWQALETEINTAVSDIQAAIADSNAPNYNAVLNDVNGAIAAWTDVYNDAGALHLDLQVNPAQLQLGMSSAQVQATLATQQPVDVISYFNQVSGTQLKPAASALKERAA